MATTDARKDDEEERAPRYSFHRMHQPQPRGRHGRERQSRMRALLGSLFRLGG